MPKTQKRLNELESARRLLRSWGAWLRMVDVDKLGFPGKTNFVISSGGKSGSYNLEDAEITEEILVHLKREMLLAFKVIEQDYYFESSIRDGAEKLNIKISEYRDLKKQGETFLFSYLVFISNSNNIKNIA